MPVENPYVTPAQPPALSQVGRGPVDANGLTNDDKTMGMLIHLLALLTGFIGVLILWLVKKDNSKFVDFHGREALNFMLTLLIYSIALVVISVVIFFVTMGFGIFLMVPLIMIIGIGQLVCEIMACIAAHRGEWHRYPLSIRIIPDVR